VMRKYSYVSIEGQGLFQHPARAGWGTAKDGHEIGGA